MFFGRKTVRLSTSPLWIIENLTQVEAAFKAEVPRQSLLSSHMPFTFENLDVYKRALQFASEIEALLSISKDSVNRGFTDQLSRASLSIPLNIAEGNGRWHQADKRQFFWVARGSVFECVPLIEMLKLKSCLTIQEYAKFRDHLEALGKMLTKLVQAHESTAK
jgi:four helix bundle protein